MKWTPLFLSWSMLNFSQLYNLPTAAKEADEKCAQAVAQFWRWLCLTTRCYFDETYEPSLIWWCSYYLSAARRKAAHESWDASSSGLWWVILLKTLETVVEIQRRFSTLGPERWPFPLGSSVRATQSKSSIARGGARIECKFCMILQGFFVSSRSTQAIIHQVCFPVRVDNITIIFRALKYFTQHNRILSNSK